MVMKIFSFFAVVIVGALLFHATGDFPAFGDPDSPASEGELSSYFIENTIHDSKVPNMVTAVLADYRGFDTMFETVVIFVAAIAIFAVLRQVRDEDEPLEGQYEAHDLPGEDDLIVRCTCNLVIPVLQIFALYVVAHGHHSPGGGFQGGVMLGASYILLALACGLPAAKKYMGERRSIILAAVGVLLYAGWGLLCVLFGGNFLDYGVLDGIIPQDEQMARSHSMLWVEIGVAFTVTAAMFAIYANLSTRGRMRDGL